MEHNKVFSRSLQIYYGGPVGVVLEKVAIRLGISPTQVLLLWAKSKGVIIVTFVILNAELLTLMCILTISSSTSKRHLEESFATGDLRQLFRLKWFIHLY